MKKLTRKKKGILIGVAAAAAIGTACAVIFGVRKRNPKAEA